MEALMYERLAGQSVKCNLCHHFCVIKEGKRGICGVRENQGGQLVALSYSKVIAASVDPIEKKPLFHLKPGSFSYSIATVGCNFKCVFCQNSNIAQMPKEYHGMIKGQDISPAAIVKDAVDKGCDSISYTYTEPTIFFELALETARLAKDKGLLNIFVTNGYMSSQAIEMICPYLDAANVDLKSFNDRFYQRYCNARLNPVKENIKRLKDKGILVEITTLLIPELNDDEIEIGSMAEYIANDLGKETPWHISRFHPSYQLLDRPATPFSALKTAYEAGRSAGLFHVYIGNVPGQSFENTYCPACQALLVERTAYQIKDYLNKGGGCPQCDATLYGIY